MSTVADKPTNLITVTDAATLIGVNDSRVRQMLIAHELDGVKFGERCWMVDRESASNAAKIRKRRRAEKKS